MELDKDYLEYLRMMGEETKDPKYLWQYLAIITDYICDMSEMPEEDKIKHELMGQYKIQPQSGGGMRKGPPPIIV